MASKSCRVSFKDNDGVRHLVEVQADSVYEAACLGLRTLKQSDWVETIGPATRIDIEVVEPPVQHFLMYAQLRRWLDASSRNPADTLRKKKLKELLA